MKDIEFKPISLSDKPIFDDYFNKTNFNNAEKIFLIFSCGERPMNMNMQ